MASTNVTSAPANPHNSFVILESFVEDALVYQPFVSEVRFEAILNQRRGVGLEQKSYGRTAIIINYLHCRCYMLPP